MGWRDTPPSLCEIKGAQAARVDGDVGPPLQTGALLAPLQPSPMTSAERDSRLSRLQNLKVELNPDERKGLPPQRPLATQGLTTPQDVLRKSTPSTRLSPVTGSKAFGKEIRNKSVHLGSYLTFETSANFPTIYTFLQSIIHYFESTEKRCTSTR